MINQNKTCTKCGVEKPLDAYHVNKNTKDGRSSQCGSCRSAQRRAAVAADPEKEKARQKKWKVANPEIVAAGKKRWRKANLEKVREHRKAWKAANPDKVRAQQRRRHKQRYAEDPNYRVRQKAWRDANREKCRDYTRKWKNSNKNWDAAYQANKRALKLKATPSWAVRSDLNAVYAESERKTYNGVSHHVDHVIPLVNDRVCGLHCADNLQVRRGVNNVKKSNSFNQDEQSELQLEITRAAIARYNKKAAA